MNKYEGDMFIYIEFDTREFAEYFKKPRQLKDDEYFDKNQGYINRFISQEDFEKIMEIMSKYIVEKEEEKTPFDF